MCNREDIAGEKAKNWEGGPSQLGLGGYELPYLMFQTTPDNNGF